MTMTPFLDTVWQRIDAQAGAESPHDPQAPLPFLLLWIAVRGVSDEFTKEQTALAYDSS